MTRMDDQYNNRTLGARYEQRAAAYLEEEGYRVVACNERTRYGEIDLIARAPDGQTLVICEVKYREHGLLEALEAVDGKKQAQVMRMTRAYLMTHKISDEIPVRFDVIAISGAGELRHIENAFDAGL